MGLYNFVKKVETDIRNKTIAFLLMFVVISVPSKGFAKQWKYFLTLTEHMLIFK